MVVGFSRAFWKREQSNKYAAQVVGWNFRGAEKDCFAGGLGRFENGKEDHVSDWERKGKLLSDTRSYETVFAKAESITLPSRTVKDKEVQSIISFRGEFESIFFMLRKLHHVFMLR